METPIKSIQLSKSLRKDGSAGQKYSVYKHIPDYDHLTYTIHLGSKQFIYEDSLNNMNWELQSGDSVVLGYNCSKASLSYHGRQWTVWYTPDISISEGPWKLCGLPGMILKAESDKQEYSFTVTAIYYASGTISLPVTKDYQKSTPQQINEFDKLRVEDPEAFMVRVEGMDLSQYELISNVKGGRPIGKKAILLEYY